MGETKELLNRYLTGLLSAEELEDFQRRIVEEPDLRAAIEAHLSQVSIGEALRGPAQPPSVSHDMLGRFVEGSLDPVDVEIVESLLAVDPALREHVQQLRAMRIESQGLGTYGLDGRSTASNPRRRRFLRWFSSPEARRLYPLMLPVGAVVALVAVVVFARERTLAGYQTGPPATRDALAAALDRLSIPSPIERMAARPFGHSLSSDTGGLIRPVCTAIESDLPELDWRRVLGARSYHVEVRDEHSSVAAAVDTASTSTHLEKRLARGQFYSWSVAAMSEQGTPIEVSSRAGPLPSEFFVLPLPRVAELSRARSALAPGPSASRIALELQYGLIDEAAADLNDLSSSNPSPEAQAAIERLQSRISQRSNRPP